MKDLMFPVGISNFEKIREGGYYYIDKTNLISELLSGGIAEVTLITRPRRFGKTINMSMMAEFFDITKDSKEIFKGTKIMETPYAAEINQYPTIFISFADAKRDKETVVSTIRTQIQNQWDKYNFVFENLKGIDDAISFLMERMEDYYGKEVMVFIDEYDTPFVEAHTGWFYDEVRRGLAGLLHNSLKTSNSLKYAFITGIQRVAKENIFSDLNNLVVVTTTSNRYETSFGFKEEEVFTALDEHGFSDKKEEVKRWYDGFSFGNKKDIYNPTLLENRHLC